VKPVGDGLPDTLSGPAAAGRRTVNVTSFPGFESRTPQGWRRRQIPDVGPTPYLPVEWFGGCSGSYFYATEEEAWEDAGRRALAWGRSLAASASLAGG